jgi:UDP-N-acetylmuramoyl-L-alanyl-D-glutamate--2,6-diaminopimelate ligase
MTARPEPVTLQALVAPLAVISVRGSLERLVDHVTRDSRAVGERSVFVAIPGASVDGHTFVDTLDAAAVVVERDVAAKAGTTVIRVPSTKEALALMAAALHGFPGRTLRVVGITGTNGKTTTATVIDGALRHLGVKVGRIGTTGNFVDGEVRPTAFTTPEAPEVQALLAEMRDAGCSVVAMEVTSIGLAQRRVDGIPFAVAVFTNRERWSGATTPPTTRSARRRTPGPTGSRRGVTCGSRTSGWTPTGRR